MRITVWKNEALAGAKLSADMFLGAGQGEGVDGTVLGYLRWGETSLQSWHDS